MNDIQKNILVTIYLTFKEHNLNRTIRDENIKATYEEIDINQIRVYFKDLEKRGYIELIKTGNRKSPQRISVKGITPEGQIKVEKDLKDKIPN